MPHEVIKKGLAFHYEELNAKAQEKARDWWCEDALGFNWWEVCYEDFILTAEIMGIEIARREKRLSSEPCIYFSGFSSQGDGACFEGRYTFRKEAEEEIKAHAPKDTDLHDITKKLAVHYAKAVALVSSTSLGTSYSLIADVKHRGHYYHARCTDINVWVTTEDDNGTFDRELPAELDEAVRECLRDFMNWMYRKLEAEYDYRLSDEVIAEEIKNNEIEFNEDGTTPVRLEKI